MKIQIKPPKNDARVDVEQVGYCMYLVRIYDRGTGFQIDEKKLMLGEPPHEAFTHAARRLAEEDGYTVNEMTAGVLTSELPTWGNKGEYLADRYGCLALSCPKCGEDVWECDGILFFNIPDMYNCSACRTQLEAVKIEEVNTKWLPIWIANGR